MPEQKFNRKTDAEKLAAINELYKTPVQTEAGELWRLVRGLKMMKDLNVSFEGRGMDEEKWNAYFQEKSEELRKKSPVLYDNLFKEPIDEADG
ncbi:MAG: hypothetical protein ABSE04_02555 [Candidatus Microgenomates bacterium]|jgi:hypothetical protein